MAISDIQAYAHLTEDDVEAIGRELDALRREIEESRGEADEAYIRRVIALQRGLDAAARVTLFASLFPPAWLAGTAMLSVAKIIENMELGHNIIHGQWDWMNDPEIHSSTWEWDNVCPSSHWKHSHNVVHHTYTNVIGKDRDVGYGLLRVTRDYKWKPKNLAQPAIYGALAALFEFGVAFHDLDLGAVKKGRKSKETLKRQLGEIGRKVRRQVVKDYVLFPALTGPAAVSTLTANLTANVVRNLWTNAVIFCGHFPDGAEKFTVEHLENETPAEWYLRQMLGSANFEGGKVMTFLTGALNYQIEHHVFPDLPSNRYPQISERVRDICERYGIPYTTGPFLLQYALTLRTMAKLSLPDVFLRRTSDDAPETSSEKKWELRAAKAA
jgi:fatty acid desaturase